MTFIFPDYNLFYIWLLLIIVFIVVEVITFNLTTIWFAFGSIISMICAYARFSLTVQIVAFLSVSILLAVFARPIAVKRLRVGKNKTNLDSLIGETGVVTKTIQDVSTGLVKVRGQVWSAESVSTEAIEEGKRVEIVEIRGVKLLVTKKEKI